MDEAIKGIKKILSSVHQMVLCTSNKNKPWTATVIFANDEDLNLYFFSSKERRHSQEIEKNKFVAGSIAAEHKKGLNERVHRGLQFEGVCKLVDESEAEKMYENFKKRHKNIVKFHDKKSATKELYKIKVKVFVLFDSSKKKMRQEVKWQN